MRFSYLLICCKLTDKGIKLTQCLEDRT
jgi:hypothetical protein